MFAPSTNIRSLVVFISRILPSCPLDSPEITRTKSPFFNLNFFYVKNAAEKKEKIINRNE